MMHREDFKIDPGHACPVWATGDIGKSLHSTSEVPLEEVDDGKPAEQDHHLWAEDRDLPLKPFGAGGDFNCCGRTGMVRSWFVWEAADQVGAVDVAMRPVGLNRVPEAREECVERAPGAAETALRLQVWEAGEPLRAWPERLSDEKHFR